MQAVVFDQAGEPGHVLRLAEVAPPKPGEGEVLVKVTARPIQPADLAFILGQYRVRPRFPQVAGLEGCGVVLESPPGAALAPGARVAFRWPGSWAELAAVPIGRVIEVPADIPDEMACQVSLNPITAWALLEEAKVSAGDCILVTAAASTVSTLVAAMARQRGVHVIGVVRSNVDDDAGPVFSVRDPALVEKIAAAAGERGVAALLDSVGGPIIPQLFRTLRAGAQIVAYGVQDREPAAITNAMLIYSNLTWKGFGIDRWLAELSAETAARMLQELWSMMREGTLTLPVASAHAFARFDEAPLADAKPGRRGKVLLV